MDPAPVVAETHDHWTWRSPARTGRAVIFDLDGVISDASHRQHYLRGDHLDFPGFFAAAADDPPLPHGRRHAALIDPALTLVIVTARPPEIQDLTLEWLDRHEIRADLVVIRPVGDDRHSAEFKRDELSRLAAVGLTIELAFDDDRTIIDMYRAAGIDACYIHSGYYDDDSE